MGNTAIDAEWMLSANAPKCRRTAFKDENIMHIVGIKALGLSSSHERDSPILRYVSQ